MKTMINNYINGNLTEARQQAKRHSAGMIVVFLCHDYGYTTGKALAVARWLKTGKGWQEACDAT